MKRLIYSTRYIVLFLIVFFSFQAATGQNREDLERERRELEKNIRLTNELLDKTKKTAESTLSQLVILNNQISKRENLISVLNSELQLLNRRINSYNTSIEELEKELEELKASYARMIYYAYRNQSSYHRLMFLFSSKDFNQAYLRLKYLQQYARHRQIQAEKIVDTNEELNKKVAQLKEEKEEQQKVLADAQKEIEELTTDKEEQNQLVQGLRKQESNLKKELREQQKSIQALDSAIARIIEEERRKAEEKAKAEGRPVSREFTLTPAEMELSRNFAKNKGKLPWPTTRGVVVGKFGERDHPVLRNIKIQNNGIDIATIEGTKARVLFDGTVSRVIYVPGTHYAVIVRHGEFLSVYSNLSEVFVKNGEKLSTKDEIGVVSTSSKDAKTIINLQIWHGTNKQNPEEWLAK